MCFFVVNGKASIRDQLRQECTIKVHVVLLIVCYREGVCCTLRLCAQKRWKIPIFPSHLQEHYILVA